jgi:pimeloyl-ACP methyl ester carboxylesterase
MRRLLLSLLFGVAIACSSGDDTTAPDPCAANTATGYAAYTVGGLGAWSVAPAATDACITVRLDSHFVYLDPAVTAQGRLYLFLPGTGAIPQYYRRVIQEAARAGYHAVGLSYPNADAVGVLCAGQGADCHGPAREEILTGADASSVVAVTRSNSIENRLLKLVAFMQAIDPGRNWSQFTVGGAIDWSRVSVAGHSQGGGHALYIARRHAVLRASAFASGGDVAGSEPATWVTQPFATPASRIYGFISVNDELVSPTGAVNAWTVIGLGAFGPANSVDGAAAPWGGSHMLLTSAAPVRPEVAIGPNHNVVVVDVNTPNDGGVPVFAGVWREMGMP